MEQKAAAGTGTAVATKKSKASSGAKDENIITKISPVTKVPAVKDAVVKVPLLANKEKPAKQVAKVAGKSPKKLVSMGVKKAAKIPVPIEPPIL